MVGLDLTGGPATMLEVLLLGRGEKVLRVSGLAVSRARESYAGGERKSDPSDACIIADQLRFRWKQLPELRPTDDRLAELRVLVSRRRDLVQDQTRRIGRLIALFIKIEPAFRRRVSRVYEKPRASDEAFGPHSQCAAQY